MLIHGSARSVALALALAAAGWGGVGAGETASSAGAALPAADAGEAVKAVPVSLTGTVAVVKAGDQVTAISLQVRQGKTVTVHPVTLDNMGRALAAHAGKSVTVAGTLRGAVLTVSKIG